MNPYEAVSIRLAQILEDAPEQETTIPCYTCGRPAPGPAGGCDAHLAFSLGVQRANYEILRDRVSRTLDEMRRKAAMAVAQQAAAEEDP